MANFEPSAPHEDPYQPPGYDPRWAAQPNRPNPMAVASLVCGLLFCVPVVTPILAVVFGFLGIRKTRNPAFTGKGMAIAGLVLGLIGIGAQGLTATVATVAYKVFKVELDQVQDVSSQFVRDISEGKIDEAMKFAGPDVRRDKIEAAAQAMKPWGPFNHLSGPTPQPSFYRDRYRWTLEGVAVFSRKDRTITMILLKDGPSYHVERFGLEGLPD